MKGAIKGSRLHYVEIVVSIRAPREGGDTSTPFGLPLPAFQSAPPVKGAMIEPDETRYIKTVSIRAPREGGDLSEPAIKIAPFSFNPRPP